MYAPIVLFTYNRLYHTQRTVEALQNNTLAKDSILYIFSDGPKDKIHENNVHQVREYIKTIQGFKKVIIIENKKNKGLANSIIDGVTQIINQHNRVIVLEDDLITSLGFLEYMNNMLDKYQNVDNIYSITGYNYPKSLMQIPSDYQYDIYFNQRPASWGWGTWKDRWENVDWDILDFNEFKHNKRAQHNFNQGGDDMSDMLIAQMSDKIDSWAIRWAYHHFKKDGYCVYPTHSYVSNIGHDGSGVHCGTSDKYTIPPEELSTKTNLRLPKEIIIDKTIQSNFRKVYSAPLYETIGKKILQYLGIYKLYRTIRYKK